MYTKRRALVFVLALAGVAGGLIATWPASATSPKPVASSKTVNQYFFHDGPAPIADLGGQIASVTLPKGNWVVTAKVIVDSVTTPGANPTPINVLCLTVLGTGPGADADTAGFSAPTIGAGGTQVTAGAPVVMSASHAFTDSGTVTVGCADFGTNAEYQLLRIEAIKVASIVRKQI